MAKGYSARRGFSNGSGQMLKQQQMQQQIMKMQEDMQKAQQEVEEKTFSASVGGGVVSAEVSGKKEVTNITIKPEAVDPDDIEMLEAVGYGFLMENGSPELRSRVPYLAPPNTEYGVARVLQQVLRQKGCVCPADFTKAH